MQLSDQPLERALLALIFADRSNLDRLGALTPEDLTDPILGAILAAAQNLQAEGIPPSLVNLKSRLEGMYIDERTTGMDVLRGLSMGPQLPVIDDVVGRLRNLALRRRLKDFLATQALAVADESQPIKVLAADAVGQLNEFLSERGGNEYATAFQLPEAAEETLQWLARGGDPVEISTGLTALDNATNGWHRGEFAIIAGRPSMGKSALALASMLATAERGEAVLFFSLEMTKRQVVARAMARAIYPQNLQYVTSPPIAYADIKPGRFSERELEQLRRTIAMFEGQQIEIETRNGLSMADIFGRVRQAKKDFESRGWNLALVVVDHLLKIRPSSRYAGHSVKELDEVSEGMCVLAKSENVAVVGLHQLNRGVESRENQRPIMSDLRGSGSLEQDADVVLLPYRPAYRLERMMQEGTPAEKLEAQKLLSLSQNILEVQIAKQRNGPTATLNFWVDMKANVVRDQIG